MKKVILILRSSYIFTKIQIAYHKKMKNEKRFKNVLTIIYYNVQNTIRNITINTFANSTDLITYYSTDLIIWELQKINNLNLCEDFFSQKYFHCTDRYSVEHKKSQYRNLNGINVCGRDNWLLIYIILFFSTHWLSAAIFVWKSKLINITKYL